MDANWNGEVADMNNTTSSISTRRDFVADAVME
jgi:hypothetical protein